MTDTPDVPVAAESETVTEPAKVMRIGSMIKQLLDEVRATQLDEASRERVAEIYARSVTEVASALSPDLQHEVFQLAWPFSRAAACRAFTCLSAMRRSCSALRRRLASVL